MIKKTIFRPFRYHGNAFILIICCLLLLLPLVAVLLIKNGQFTKGHKSYRLAYSGSYGWLYFWSILFFPIMILLLILKGVDVIELSDEIIYSP